MILEKADSKIVNYRVKKGGHVFRDTPVNLVQQHIVDDFSPKDRKMILSSYTLSPTTERKQFNIYACLLSLLITTLLIAIPLSPFKISIFSSLQPAGILFFPFSFAILDTINEFFGRKHACFTVYMVAVMLLFAAMMIFISLHLDFPSKKINALHQAIYENLPKLLLINCICLLIADNTNNFVFSKLKHLCNGRYLALRCLISTVIGQFLYSLIWISLFFNSKLQTPALINYIIDNYAFKLVYSLSVCIPCTILAVKYLKSKLDE